MSKATAPCSSCPSSKSTPTAEKSSSVYTPTIECVLEDVLPIDSDATIKVKNFKNFLGYDLKTLNITGELQTTIHKNGFTHTKMIVTYQDKKSKKVSYLEIDILDNTNKKVENKKLLPGCGNGPSSCANYINNTCNNNFGENKCDPQTGITTCCCLAEDGQAEACTYYYNSSNGTVTTSTNAGGYAGSSAAKPAKTVGLQTGTQVRAQNTGRLYKVVGFVDS